MAITISCSRVGTNPNYERFLFGKPTKTWRAKESILLDLKLLPYDDFVKLQLGDYVTISTAGFDPWYTGYVTAVPELEFVGGRDGVAKYAYTYKLTDDSYILNLKQIGIIPPFLNMSYGRIIRLLAERLAPGQFDLTNVQDGPIVAVYQPTPDQKFLDVINDLTESSRFIFYAQDGKLYFLPQDEPDQIVISALDPNFTPSQLSLRASSTPAINDVTVLGELEPQTYVHEYFVGTGVDGEFPLVANVFGIENTTLIDEQFGGTLNNAIWDVNDTVADYLQIQDNYLNILGGEGTGANTVRVHTNSGIPMEGRYRVIQGEWDFLGTTANGTSGKAGVIGGFWSQTPNLSLTGCLYGLQVTKSGSNVVINPVLNGVLDGAQSFTVDTTKRYVIRTLVEFFKLNRLVNSYVYIDSSGNRVELTAPSTSDDVHWQSLISEVDPATGAITRQLELFSLGTVNNTVERYATFCPVISDNLRASVSNISISVPVNATLEVREQVQLENLSFDQWETNTEPIGWTDFDNAYMDDGYANSGKAAKIQADAGGGGYLKQLTNDLIVVGEAYYVTLRAQKTTGATAGNLKIYLQSDSLAYTSTPVTVAVSTLTDFYKSYEGTLVTSLPNAPSDLKFVIETEGMTLNESVWVDDIIIYGDWKTKLVGPNEIDALDGITPVATVISGNVDNRNSITGTVQYNPGQNRLVFFKDSATLTSDVPPEFHLVRLSYRAAGASIARVNDGASITLQAAQWGDDGIRSVVRNDVTPRPRSSLECELAAKALVASSRDSVYEGSYRQWSSYLTGTPMPGMLLKFENHADLPADYIQEVTGVIATLESSQEHIEYNIDFGKRDNLKALLGKINAPKGSYQVSSGQAPPISVDVDDVGTSFIDDVTAPYLVGWDDDEIFLNTGEAAGTNCIFEVRYTDEGWGSGAGKNLLVASSSQTITVPRTRRGRVVFIRRVNTVSGLTSRYSACVHTAFPVPEVPQVEEPLNVPGLETSVPLVVNTGGIFDGVLVTSWTGPDEAGNKAVKLDIQYDSPNPLENFVGVAIYIQRPEGSPAFLTRKEFPGSTPGTANFVVVADGLKAGDFITVYLVSYSNTFENDLDGAPYRTTTVATYPVGLPTEEYTSKVTSQTASVEYGYTEDGSQGYRFRGSFTEPASDTTYGGCKVFANPVGTGDYIEVADCQQGQTTFVTDLWSIQHDYEDFIINFVSYDTSGRRNTIGAGTPKSATLTVEKQIGGAGQEYANKPVAFSASVGYAFTESGDQKYRFQGSVTHATSDPRYKGCMLVARTGNLNFSVSIGYGNTDVYSTQASPIFSIDMVGKTITIGVTNYTIVEWVNSVLIRISSPIAGPVRPDSAVVLMNEDIYFYDLPVGQTTFNSDEWSVNHQSESFTLYAVSYDSAGRINTIVPGTTPQASVTVVRQEGPAGAEVDNVAVTTFEGPLVQTSQIGETLWYLSGDIFTPFDPRYGGCSIRILNVSDPLKSQEIAFVPKGDKGETLKFKTELLTPGLGTLTIIFLSVDTNNRPNSYAPGTTPSVIVVAPIQGSTLNLAYSSPSSLQTAAFASSIRPISLLASNPGLPNALYPSGTIIYNTSDARLYKVDGSGTTWVAAINGGLDIQADSITAGQIAAGAISTTELAAGEIKVGQGGGKPTRFTVVDSFNNTLAFIGDNGAGFVGAYALNLRVGPNINLPNILASGSGVTIENAPLTMTTNGITTTINNVTDGVQFNGVQVVSGVNYTKIGAGFNGHLQTFTSGYGYCKILPYGFGLGNSVAISFYNSSNQAKIRIGATNTYPAIEVFDGSVYRNGYTGQVQATSSLGFGIVTLNFTAGIMTHVT